MPLLLLLSAFATGAFVAHSAHAALRENEKASAERHEELKALLKKAGVEHK